MAFMLFKPWTPRWMNLNVRDDLKFRERFAIIFTSMFGVKAPSQPVLVAVLWFDGRDGHLRPLHVQAFLERKQAWYKGFEWPRTIYNLSSCHMCAIERYIAYIAISPPHSPSALRSIEHASARNVNVPHPSPASSWNLKHHGHLSSARSNY